MKNNHLIKNSGQKLETIVADRLNTLIVGGDELH